jgi:hypothetical protein
MTTRWSAASAFCAAFFGAVCLGAGGCGEIADSKTLADAGPDGTATTDSPNGQYDGGATDASADARPDVLPDANACHFDASTVVCCCSGDVGGNVVCKTDGTIGCAASNSGSPDPSSDSLYRVYYGDDCTRPCGPCSIACSGGFDGGHDADVDAGSDSIVDAGVDATRDANVVDASDAD